MDELEYLSIEADVIPSIDQPKRAMTEDEIEDAIIRGVKAGKLGILAEVRMSRRSGTLSIGQLKKSMDALSQTIRSEHRERGESDMKLIMIGAMKAFEFMIKLPKNRSLMGELREAVDNA